MNHKQPFRHLRRFRQIGYFLLAAFLLPMLLMLLSTPVWATESVEQKSITIGAQEVINDDLYLMADIVTIDGIVKGDAVVAASRITLNGTVEGDLIAAGQVITVNGTVNDDVRMAGQVLLLGQSARVKDDVVAAGYSLENRSGSAIGGSLTYFGGQGLLSGTVQQTVRGAAASLQLTGSVKGNVDVMVGTHELSHPPFLPDVQIPQVPSGLTLTDTAQIGGELTYHSAADAKISPAAAIAGRVVRENLSAEVQPDRPAVTVISHLQRLLALMLIGWLVLRFAPNWLQSLSTTVQARPLPSLGWGIVTVAAVLAATIAVSIVMGVLLVISGFLLPSLALPILGIGLFALFALFLGFGIVVSFIPPIILSFLGGQWIMAKFHPDQATNSLAMLVIGLVGFVILTALPAIGGVFNAIITFLGLGALWLGWHKRDRRGRNAQPTGLVLS
jgi:cytoskeletal protein CcmA (bactofilin family)